MLNRLFIIVGLIAILALGAAFVVPGFIRWEDYRDRMEAMASQTLGAPVQITGEIKFAVLPEPQLRFTKVVVGAVDRPVMTVEQVEARFSLVDF
ncbi:MAG: AsmA family protein, partial [Devosia sp.]